MRKIINLNADVGESFGAWTMGHDEALLAHINSANIACGFHAGDPLVMRQTVQLAQHHQVSIGAHPSFPDLQGFGRRIMQLTADEIQTMLIYQMGALAGLAATQHAQLTHVKPHGALNNLSCENKGLAEQIVKAVKQFNDELIILAPACSALAEAANDAKMKVALEIFADRTYTETGHLRPRSQNGAVLHDAESCVRHVLNMLDAGGIVTPSGICLATPIHSICVHGDTPAAIEIVKTLKNALENAGWTWATLPALFDF